MEKIQIDSLFSQNDKEKLEILAQLFEKKIYQTLDSLSQNAKNIFQGFEKQNADFLFIPKICPTIKTGHSFVLSVELSFLTLTLKNIQDKGKFSMYMEKKALENDAKDVVENILPFLKKHIAGSYNLYIPITYLDYKTILPKNKDENQLNIVFFENKKFPIMGEKIASLLLDAHQLKGYFNVFFDEKNTVNVKKQVKMEYILKTKGRNYILYLLYKGKDLILKYPSGEPIKTLFVFDKKRFDEGDYSEFGYLVKPDLSSFIIMNK